MLPLALALPLTIRLLRERIRTRRWREFCRRHPRAPWNKYRSSARKGAAGEGKEKKEPSWE